MAQLIGTAGHVDHGKTSLIQALTGINADRLPEEQERGMTIDIGFAYLDFEDGKRVSIVDVPGHQKFLNNMLVGALGMDVALLCVAADESVMPQTREHFEILRLLPVQKLIVAMTRCDVAEPELKEICRSDVGELLAESRFAGATIVETSSETGEGLEELKQLLQAALSHPEPIDAKPWYLPIDRVFVVKGQGVVVTGTLAQGSVKEGDTAEIVPGRLHVKIRGIQWHEKKQKESEKGRRTAFNLGGLKAEQIHRGMAIGAPGTLFETSILDAHAEWLAQPKHGLRVRISIGACEVMAKQFLNDTDPHLVQLRLENPVAAAKDQPLIVRRYSPPDLLWGGRVLVPQAVLRRRSESTVIVDAESGELADQIEAFVERHPFGVATEEVCRNLAQTAQALGGEFEKLKLAGRLHGFAGVWLSQSGLTATLQAIEAALRNLHSQNPTKSGIPKERVVAEAKLPFSGKPLDRLFAYFAEVDALVVQGNDLRLPEFRVQLNARQRELLDRVIRVLEANGLNTPTELAIAKEIHVPIQAVEEILIVGRNAGEIVRIGDGIYYSLAQISEMKNRIADLAREKPFTAAEFRDKLQTTRKYAIPLLEYFDATRFTMRQGDLRVLV